MFVAITKWTYLLNVTNNSLLNWKVRRIESNKSCENSIVKWFNISALVKRSKGKIPLSFILIFHLYIRTCLVQYFMEDCNLKRHFHIILFFLYIWESFETMNWRRWNKMPYSEIYVIVKSSTKTVKSYKLLSFWTRLKSETKLKQIVSLLENKKNPDYTDACRKAVQMFNYPK